MPKNIDSKIIQHGFKSQSVNTERRFIKDTERQLSGLEYTMFLKKITD